MQPQSDTAGRQASVDTIDCHDAMRSAAAGSLGCDWKEATLSKLRLFLMTQSLAGNPRLNMINMNLVCVA
jgi:hypothetical protein